ncbi:hypothetical protein [Microcella sp.]|uniref:hypothetical protein n=1 Tax=Microcella sp. TaxID=1913979 RepID=UPI003F708C3B
MLDTTVACLPPGSGGDPAGEFRRQAVLVDDLRLRLDDIVRALPSDDALAGWWGPARDALQGAIDLERARLGREAARLDGVRIQLQAAAAAAPGLGGASS